MAKKPKAPDPSPSTLRKGRNAPLLPSGNQLDFGKREEDTYHAVTVKQFPNLTAYAKYRKDTGLDTPHQSNPNMFLSRRGSVGGFEMSKKGGGSGKVDTYRISSGPTSRALAKTSKKRGREAYEEEADKIEHGVTNSNDRKTTTNVVMSEAFVMEHKPGKGFVFQEPPQFATGASATGLPTEVDQPRKRRLFAPAIETAENHGFAASATSTFHSEPMALGRMDPIPEHSVVMTTSSPNDMCVNCGRTYAEHLKPSSTVSAMGGVPFGGQKPGFDNFSRKNDSKKARRGAQVFRAHPTKNLRLETINEAQVEAVRMSGSDVLTWK